MKLVARRAVRAPVQRFPPVICGGLIEAPGMIRRTAWRGGFPPVICGGLIEASSCATPRSRSPAFPPVICGGLIEAGAVKKGLPSSHTGFPPRDLRGPH